MPRVTHVYTLTGLTRLSTILALQSTRISMLLTFLEWRTKSGGPIAKGDSAMITQADGDSYNIDEGDTETSSGAGDCFDATQIYFLPTNSGDKIFIEARSR